jgi:PEGA domain
MPTPARLLPLLSILFLTGCITRLITVQSNPSGALVYLNGEEVGRTPVPREFQWYGTYDVIIRKDGYQTIKTSAAVSAPIWQFIPLDFLTDLLPVTDEHILTYNLEVQPPANPAEILSNGEQMRTQLESSERTKTKIPATRPATTTTRPTSH